MTIWVLCGLVVTGVIAFMLWPRSPVSTTTAHGVSETYSVELTTSPRSGEVTTVVEVTRHDERPVGLAEVVIEPVMPAMGHAMPHLVARRHDDRFEARGELFTMGGLWDVSLRLAGETVTVQIAVTEG